MAVKMTGDVRRRVMRNKVDFQRIARMIRVIDGILHAAELAKKLAALGRASAPVARPALTCSIFGSGGYDVHMRWNSTGFDAPTGH